MGLDGLIAALAAAGISPPAPVVLGDAEAPAGPAWHVRPVDPGPTPAEGAADGSVASTGWEVFWAEDGRRYAWTLFDDEACACFALFGRLVWARLVAVGRLPAAG